MFTGKYIATMSGLLGGIVLFPAFDDMMKIALFVSVILIAVLFHLLLFWEKLQDRFIKEVFPKFLLQLFKSEDFVDYLIEKQRKRKKHEN